MPKVLDFDKRAAEVKSAFAKNKGIFPESAPEGQLDKKATRGYILQDLPAAVRQLDSLRTADKDRAPIDISLAQFAQDKWGFGMSESGSPDSLYHMLGVQPGRHSIQSLMNMPEFQSEFRWLVPEVIREAIRLGLRKNPAYPSMIASEINVDQPKVTMPYINMSDAMVKKVGETETIPVGTTTFGQKDVKLHKLATGLKLSDEVVQFVPLNILSIYLQDVGVQLNYGLDTAMAEVMINGDQADGSEAAPVVGVNSVANGITYDNDLLKAWIRMSRMGRVPSAMVSNEEAAINILKLPEFKTRDTWVERNNINLQTPVPQTTNYFVHGAFPTGNQVVLVDPTSALVKLNAMALKVESERIVERQLSGTYVSLITGFANLFRDARLVINGADTLVNLPYPEFFNVDSVEQQTYK